MDRAPFLESLSSDVSVIAETLAGRPDATVLHCPGWTVSDLARHHGSVMRWAAQVVRTGEPAELDPDGPAHLTDPTELTAWYSVSAAPLVAELAEADPERSCWTFGSRPRTVAFWIRRQALEAAIHRWDAQQAVGRPLGFPPEIARAGIDEVVDELFPRQVRLERTDALDVPVALRSDDDTAAWTLSDDGTEPVVTVRGRVDHLLLWLWRRLELDDPALEVTGSAPQLAQLRSSRFAP